LLAGIITLAFTWKQLILELGGYETPQLETAASFSLFAESNGGTAHFMAVAADKMDYKYLQKGFGVPGLVVFNKQGQPVNSSASTGCPTTARHFLDTINAFDTYEVNRKNLRLQDVGDVLQRISFVKGDSARFAALLQSDSIDYIAVYSWAKFLPAQSGYMMKGINETSGKKKNILVLSLNLDFPDLWMTQAEVDEFNGIDEITFASK
jgi:hypothetical protein